MTQEQTRKAADTIQAQTRKNLETAQDQVLKNAATVQTQTRQNLETVQQQVRVAAAAGQDQWKQNLTAMQDQMRQNMTIAQDQFRQNVSLWQEQMHSLGAQWRQAFTEPQAATRQLQEAMTEGAERLTTQGTQVANAAFGATWDTWQAALGVATWGQEQVEQVLRQVLEQSRIGREETVRLFREMGEQARRNQEIANQMAQDGVHAGTAAFRFPDFAQPFVPTAPAAPAAPVVSATQFDALIQKVDDLSRKLDALQTAPLNGTTPAAPAATKVAK